jgi:hypothetical protein
MIRNHIVLRLNQPRFDLEYFEEAFGFIQFSPLKRKQIISYLALQYDLRPKELNLIPKVSSYNVLQSSDMSNISSLIKEHFKLIGIEAIGINLIE